MKQTDSFAVVALGYYSNIAIPSNKIAALADILGDAFAVKRHYSPDGDFYARLAGRWETDPALVLGQCIRDYVAPVPTPDAD
jgi:hypothetical protein